MLNWFLSLDLLIQLSIAFALFGCDQEASQYGKTKKESKTSFESINCNLHLLY